MKALLIFSICLLLGGPVSSVASGKVAIIADEGFMSSAKRIAADLVARKIVSFDEVVVLPASSGLRVLEQEGAARTGTPVVISSDLNQFRKMAARGVKAKGIFFSHGPWASGADDVSLSEVPMLGVRVSTFMGRDQVCIDWLKAIVPSIRRVGIVFDSGSSESYAEQLKARLIGNGIDVRLFVAKDANAALQLIRRSRMVSIDAWYFPHTPVVWEGPQQIIAAAREMKVPLAFEYSHYYAREGGLLACASQFDSSARLAEAVSMLLDSTGADVRTEFRPAFASISVNADTARILGIAIPARLLRRTDHVFTDTLNQSGGTPYAEKKQ